MRFLDAFLPIKKAPIIEVELADGAGRITEICTDEAHFQLMAQPRLAADAEQGAKVQAFFTIKNLNSVPRDCYLGVQLIDGQEVELSNPQAPAYYLKRESDVITQGRRITL